MNLFPEKWITNYEKLHKAVEPVQSADPVFVKRSDGIVETFFKKRQETPTVLNTQFGISSFPRESHVPITHFDSDGKPIYALSMMVTVTLMLVFVMIIIVFLMMMRKNRIKEKKS